MIPVMLSTERAWPARTAEWQARVAARRSFVPATTHSRPLAVAHVAEQALQGRPRIAGAEQRGNRPHPHRAPAKGLHVVAERRQRLAVLFEQGQTSSGASGHTAGARRSCDSAARRSTRDSSCSNRTRSWAVCWSTSTSSSPSVATM